MQGLLQPETEEQQPETEEYPLEQDEAYQSATQWVFEQLYKGEIGDNLHTALKETEEPTEVLAESAFRIAEKADEFTEGNIAEENLVMLGMFVLNEVLEVAEDAGHEIDEAKVSQIFKRMILKWLNEQGIDSSEIEQSFNNVDDNEFAQFAQGVE